MRLPVSVIAALAIVSTASALTIGTIGGIPRGEAASSSVSVIPRVTASDHVRGQAKARVILVEYADFECPFCRRHHPVMKSLLKNYPKDVKWVYRHFPLSFHPHARPAAIASECVATLKGNTAFWSFADKVFALDELPEDFTDIAVSAGVNIADFRKCLEDGDGSIAEAVDEDYEGGSKDERVSGTPMTFVLDARNDQVLYATVSGAQPQAEFEKVIEALLAGEANPLDQPEFVPEPSSEKPLPTFPSDEWEEPELGPVPPVGDDEPIQGKADARITIVEYGDLECPFCKKVHPTIKALLRKNRGKVNWVFRHFPLSFHPEALPAAEAAECVRELKGDAAYWTFLDGIYKADALNAKLYTSLATKAKVKPAALRTCLKSDRHLDAIQATIDAGAKAGIQGTPGFFLIDHQTGKTEMIAGAYPESHFQEKIDAMLKAKR